MKHSPKSESVPASLRGLRKPRSPRSIREDAFRSADVKDRLRADQRGKCIYCESLLRGDYGHVEHFRPKGGYSCYPDSRVRRPGYYWLAYNWSNLLLSCSVCNTSFKRSHFPLADESKRRIATRDISAEEPLLINPSAEDPARLLKYRQHILSPRTGLSESDRRRAFTTIELLGLNSRPDLVAARRAVYESFRRWRRVLRLADALAGSVGEAEAGELRRMAEFEMQRMKAAEAEYSSMLEEL